MYIDEKNSPIPNDDIEKVLDSGNWARLRGGSFYLIYSDRTPLDIRKDVQRILSEDAHIMVAELDLGNRSGWISTITIDWIEKIRKFQSSSDD